MSIKSFIECSLMLDFPNMPRSQTQNKKKGEIWFEEDNGVPKLGLKYGNQIKKFELDSKDLTQFIINSNNIDRGLISITLCHSYGNICSIMVSDPSTMEGLLNVVEALSFYIH